MQQNGLEVTDEMEDAMQEHEEKGHTAVLVGIDGKDSMEMISNSDLRDDLFILTVFIWEKLFFIVSDDLMRHSLTRRSFKMNRLK